MGTRLRDQTLSTELAARPVEEDRQRYFQYDAMNRQTVVDAVDTNGNLGTEGHRLTYDLNGNRASDTRNGIRIVEQGGAGSGSGQWAVEGGESTEVYGYDGLNRLVSTVRDGALVEARGYDAAHRVLSSAPAGLGVDYITLQRQQSVATGNAALQARQSLYDANGRMVHQKTTEYLVAENAVNYDYDAEGNVLGYLVADTVNNTFTRTANTVVRAEGYRTAESVSETKNAITGALMTRGGLGYHYDTNGHLNFVGDAGQMTHPTLRTHNFVNDANGNALYAYYAYEGTPQVHANGQRQLVVNGEVLGRYGLLADTRFEGTPLAQNGPLFSAQSDFSFGYQPIDGNYPAGSPGTYAVATGDTLQSIARGAYGDASLWYLIADANGLSSDADLRTGQVLRIPTRVGSADNAGTIKPYDPSKIASDSATMMAMPQSQDGGCGGIGQIIIIVVAIVVTIWTAGAAAGAWGAVGTAGTATASAGIGATMTTGLTALGGGYGALGVAAAVVGGAVGSAVSQAVGIGIGAQDQFSWKQVALSAIGSGVSAGLGIAGALPDTGSVLGNAALRGAVGNSLTQGIAVVTGLQDKFDWKSVAASAVGAGVGAAVGPTIGSAFESAFGSGAGSAFGARLATGLLAGAATAVMRGGKVSMQQVAVDAFGNALGDSIAAANGRGSSVRPFGETDAEAWGHVPAGAGYDYQGSGNGISNWQVNVAAQEAADGQWFDAQRDTTIERLQQEAGLPSSASYRTLRAGGMTVLPTEVQPHAPPRFSEASPYGPMTPIASGINEYGNPDYIWNSAGTRSDAIPDRFAEARSLGQLPPMASAPAISTAESQALAAALGGEFSLLSSDLDPAIASNMGNSWVTSSAGATAGVGVSLGKMAYGTARLVSNALYQGSDIATLGTLHDTPAIRQAWAENTALGNGIINAVSSPREATTNLVEGIANRYNSAMSITGNDFQRSYQLGELFNDIGQAGVGGIYGARGLARWGATELQGLGVADWNFVARDVPTWGPYRTQAGAIGIGLERIEGPVRAEAINGSSRTVPLGFEGEAQFLRAGGELDAALRASGINDATIGVRGSSVVGGSARKGTQFGPQSDVDFWVESAALTEGRPTSTAIEGMVNANRVMKAYPELRAWSQRWTDALGRKITPAGFQPGTVPLEPAIALRR